MVQFRNIVFAISFVLVAATYAEACGIKDIEVKELWVSDEADHDWLNLGVEKTDGEPKMNAWLSEDSCGRPVKIKMVVQDGKSAPMEIEKDMDDMCKNIKDLDACQDMDENDGKLEMFGCDPCPATGSKSEDTTATVEIEIYSNDQRCARGVFDVKF